MTPVGSPLGQRGSQAGTPQRRPGLALKLCSGESTAMGEGPFLSRMEQEAGHMVGCSLPLEMEGQRWQVPTWGSQKAENSNFTSDLPKHYKGMFLRLRRQNIS